MSKLFFIVGLGTVLVVSLVLCASQPALTHPALAAADLPIYTDALAGGWQDWSWDTTRSFDNAQPVHSGSASIAITYTTAWAGFYLTGTALPASDYTAIRFWVHGGSTGGQSVNFHLDAGDSYPFTVQANTWLSVTVPFAALGNPITLSALIWQDNSGSDLGQPTIYLDDISLIAPTPLTGVNLSGRTEGATQIGYPFMATVDPMTTILPITYTWQSDGQTPVIHTGDNLTDTVTFTWTIPGPKVITVTASNELGTVTSTHLITLAAADLPIYTDALAGGWQDWSWDTTRSFDNAQPVHSGSASIAITYTTAWAGFYLTGTALPASDYTAIRFWVHGGGTGGQSVNFHLDAGDSYPFTVQANTWLSVTIPFAALGNPITLSALIWQDNSGSDLGQPTIYLDDISLVGRPPDIGTWSAVTSSVTYTLRSVSMLSANDGWAVGYEGYYDNGIPKGSAILRRNGNMWNEWGSDSSGPALFAVTTVSDTDGWAAGSDSGDGSATLRWNGSAWNSVTHPSGQRLYSVAMVSADDGWAVGGGGRCDPGLRLTGTIMRWDGSAWSADSILDRVLYSVAMVSANDGWAVGYYCRYLGGYPIPTWDTNSVVMRWNGSSWNEISPPTYQTLDSVAMVSATDGWAVGILGTIMHWNGSSWSWSRSPTSCNLRSVSMVSADDGWAVGGGGANCPSQPSVILHWNGIAWGEIVSPVSQTLNSVAMTSANEGWAVGDAGTILHYTNLKNLNVNKTGTGSGTVTSSPAGIDCGATCSASFDYNTSVILTATASSGSTFAGWSGSGCSDTGICPVNMDAVKSVTANFTQNEYTLTITYLPLCAKNYCPGQFFDDFTNPDSRWGAWESPEWKFGGLNGEFQIILKNTDSWFWDTPSLVLPSDYVMEVDARHATTNLGNYGLMFGVRYSGNDPVELYQFVVSPSSQEYFMEKYNNGTWTTLIDWTYDSRINYGMVTNHLSVRRVGTSISVGVNSYWLETVYDGDFTSAGRDGGLKVFSYANAPTDMRFDNFLVTCPQ